MSNHILYIPSGTSSAAEVLHSEYPIDLRLFLMERGHTDPRMFTLPIRNEGTEVLTLVFHGGPPNERARAVIADLTGGVHIVVAGDALLMNLDEQQMARALNVLGSEF